MFVRAAQRPAGRADITAIDRLPTVTTVRDAVLNNPAGLAAATAKQITFATTSWNMVKFNGVPDNSLVLRFDANAITNYHRSDQSGVMTVAHELFHAIRMANSPPGALDWPGDFPTSAAGPAAKHGAQVSTEATDMTLKEAVEWLNELALRWTPADNQCRVQ
jgi:hypothetical protein